MVTLSPRRTRDSFSASKSMRLTCTFSLRIAAARFRLPDGAGAAAGLFSGLAGGRFSQARSGRTHSSPEQRADKYMETRILARGERLARQEDWVRSGGFCDS